MATTKTPLLSNKEASLRAQLYRHQRLENQKTFYRNRIEEFKTNSGCMLYASAGLMGISTTISLLSISGDSAFWMLLTAILPAFAAAAAAFRELYQWERQTTLYEDTLFELERAEVPIVGLSPTALGSVFTDLLYQSENVFQNEAGQWGQIKGVMPTDKGPAAAVEDEEDEEP